MSREGSDYSYRPKLRAAHSGEVSRRRERRQRATRVDYTKVEILSETDSEGTIENKEVDLVSVKSEREENVSLTDINLDQNSWTPQTLTKRANQLTEQVGRLAKTTRKEKMAREGEKGELVQIMEMMMQMRAEDKKAEQRKEESRIREMREQEDRRVEREVKREDEREAREQRLLTTLREAQPAVPQTVTIQSHKLPEMKDSDDAELFMSLFEAALLSNNIPEDQWKNKLHSQLSMKAKLKIHSVMQDNDSTYKDIKDALLGCTAMSFSSAAEDFCTGERGRLTNLEPRQAIEKMARLAGKIMKEAVDITSSEPHCCSAD